MGKPGRARAFEPDHPLLEPTLQVAAAPVLGDERMREESHVTHGPDPRRGGVLNSVQQRIQTGLPGLDQAG